MRILLAAGALALMSTPAFAESLFQTTSSESAPVTANVSPVCKVEGLTQIDLGTLTIGNLQGTTGPVVTVTCNTTKLDQVEAALKKAVETFGPVNVLVANAGGWPAIDRPSSICRRKCGIR